MVSVIQEPICHTRVEEIRQPGKDTQKTVDNVSKVRQQFYLPDQVMSYYFRLFNGNELVVLDCLL